MRWTNPEKARYYEVHLVVDLFGDWNLITVWGGLDSPRGGMNRTAFASFAEGERALERIAKRRQRRGYRRAGVGAGTEL